MRLDDPLARPWTRARLICLWTTVAAWTMFWVNSLATEIARVADAALAVVMIAVLALVPVQILGRAQATRKSKTAEQMSKETERMRHFND